MRRLAVNRPLVFAHRGASKVAPENTLPAFAKAVELGADGVELDVRYTRDGHLVIMHNPELGETSNGEGRVIAHTLEQVRALDAGSWFAPEFAGTRIPTLDEVLDLLAGKCLINIEIKSDEMRVGDLAKDVVEAVHHHDLVDDVVISSFNPFVLRPVKRLAPEIEIAYLTARDLAPWLRWGITRAYSRADGLHPDYEMVDRAYVTNAHKHRRPVRVWTVDNEDDMRRMVALDVDAIVTNLPDRLRAVLNLE